ncbi:MAG: serpin family protein [Candidatus Omnitrophota bacterium]|nr:serpin family protein [Candidatus Omnitrophota bacterium]
MKKGMFGSLVLLVGSMSLSSIAFAQDNNSVVNVNNQFAFDLYSKYKSKDGNIFYSPYSISSALAMTYEGARGKTGEEMQAVFLFPQDASMRRDSFLKIYQQINKKDKKYKLSMANALWAQRDYKFLEDYFSLVEKYYGGKTTNLDFVKETEKSRLTINSWVEEQTNYKIKDLIPPGILNSLTRLVLTNAIYFKGFWLKQFDKKDTKEEDFSITPANKIKAKMMYLSDKEASFNYAETDKLQIVELPYEGNDLSMLILLPKEDDLKAIEESLNFKKLSEWKSLLQSEVVNISLPKFKFETKYFMAQDLQDMGMPTAFTQGIDFGGKADFSGMTGNKDLHIDQVIHQAFVEVNEEGTEAAAATAVVMETGFVSPNPIKIFKADHPFIFIIQDRETGNILFIGRVSDPTR